MGKPFVTFPDPEAFAIQILTAGFAARLEPYVPDLVDVGFPPYALTKTPLKTFVQVELELGGTDFYPVAERAQVRFNCWAPNGERAAVKDLASLAQGIVLAHTDATPQTGRSDVTEDPDTGYLMVWFTAVINLPATLLAS